MDKYVVNGQGFDVEPQDLEIFLQRYPDAQKFEKPKTDQIRHAEAETVARETLTDFYSDVSGIPKFALPFVTGLTGGAAGLVSGLFKNLEAQIETTIGMSAEEQRKDDRNIYSTVLDAYHDFTNAFDTKYYDEDGKSLQFDELLEKGEWSKAARVAAEQGAESAPSMIISAYNPVLGGALLGVSTAGTTYYDDLENRPDATLNEVIKNSLIAGSSEFATEWAGGKAFRGISKIGLKLAGTGTAGTVAKEYTKSFVRKFVERTLGGGIGEAATESLNSAIQDLGEDWVYDEKLDKKQFVSNIINSIGPALMLGGFGGGMSTLNKQDRKDLYKFTADGKWKREFMDIGSQIYQKSNDYKVADDKQKIRIKEELDALQNKKQKHEQNLFDAMENLSDKELTDRAKRLDKINENAGIVGNDNFSEATQKQREQETLDLIQQNYDILGLEYTAKDIEIDKLVSESLKVSERLDPTLEKLKGVNKEDIKTEVIRTDKELQALPEDVRKNVEKGDGYFLAKDKDGKAKIYINARLASLSGASNVVAYELLHYMVSKKFKTDNKSMKPFVDNLKNYLQKNHGEVYTRLQTRIDNFYTNPDGTIKDNALEEYLTVFSDLVATQKIDLKENESKGFRDSAKDIILGFGVGDVQLDTAQDFIKFIRAYNKNINRKGLLGKLMGTKILDVTLESKTLVKGQTKDAKKKSMSAAEVKQVEERVTEIGLTYNIKGGKKLWDEGGSKAAINEIVKDGLLNNLIASKYKVSPVPPNFVKDVLAQLSPDIKGFNPEENNDLGGYLGPRINFRAGDIYKKIYEKKGPVTVPTEAKTKEGEVKIQIAAETDAAMKAFETEDLSPAAQAAEKSEKQKRSDLDKKLNLTEADINKFISTLEKAFGTKLPLVTSKEYRQALEKIITTDLKNTIQKIFGKGVDYDIFVEQDIPLLLRDIRVEALIQMERDVGGKRFPNGKKIFATKRRITKVKEVRELQSKGLIAKDVKPESGPNLLTRLPRPNKKEINAWFRGINMKEVLGYELSKSAFGTRKDRFAENLAIEIGFNKAMEVVQNPKILAKRLDLEELQGREQVDNYVAEVGRTIDRDPNIKFSKGIEFSKKELNLNNADLKLIFKENNLNQLEANYPQLYDGLIYDMENKYGPQNFENKRYLNQISQESLELEKIVKDKKHITRKKEKGESIFEVERLKNQFNNYSLGVLDFIPSFMGVRENKVKGNYKFLTNGLFKGSSSRGNAGETLEIRNKRKEKFQNKHTNNMGKLLTPKTKKLWSEFNKVKDNLELAESTFDMPETLLRDLRKIQRSNKTAKQKIKEAQKLFNPGALDAAQKLFTAYNTSIQDWVNYQVKNNNMTREEAMEYVIRDKQKNSNFTKGERALAAFTSVYFENGSQKLEKKDSKGEHVKDSATVSALTTISIYNNTFVQDASSILNGFEQSYVPKKFANEMDRLGGENSPLKNFRFILNPKIGKSVYDLATGKTMYEIGLEQYKLDQVKMLEEIYNKNKNKPLNTAIKRSRSSKNPTKGMSAWDMDDTLARTKSGVIYTVPNPSMTPQPKRKVIFMAGGPGSGKSSVIKGLGLKEQGFKIVNQDISLEWLMKNNGLPTDMKDFTPEQASKFGSLSWDARMIAKRKQTKFQGQGDGIIVDGTGNSLKTMQDQVQEFKNKGYDVQMIFVETSLETALERNRARKERSLRDGIVKRTHESVQSNKQSFKEMFAGNFTEIKTDNLKQNDPMPAKAVKQMDKFTKSYIKGRLDAGEFAAQGADILAQDGEFDFSEFDIIKEGTEGPLFGKAMDRAKKFGTKDQFIITARPHAAKIPIFRFLQARGLNIPIENIVTLENSTPEAKALWIAGKVGEGYNDIYFADDHLENVQAVDNILKQFDVKGKVQQAKIKFSKGMNDRFNDILENVTGIESKKRFSAIKGRKRGESKGKFRFFIPPSHEDFVGLLYNFLGKGKEGNAHRDFFEQALIRPLNRANREYDTARQSVANDYKALNKQFVDVRKKLTKKTPDGDFTFQDAIRVYLWNKHNHNIPGLSETDQQNLVDLVTSDPQLQVYAETLNVISKQETYVNPTDGWNGGDIRMDLDDATGRIGRQQFFAEFIENSDVIFSEENLNKIEAGYGKGVRESLEDMLYRIKTGRNRPTGQNAQVNKLMNYLNGSVGTVMFFNMRSALLQQMSLVNYINFADNNIFAAAKAFANQKQYWKDFAFIFNSDMLKQRRGGIQTDVNGAELAASLRNSKDVTRKLVSKLLELGFLPTQIGDNIAIATGGAPYYRNRINTYIKQGMNQKEAEAKAFTDFQGITQSTQQSARPDMVSKQQASVIGKVILNFQNVTSQFNRLGKKAFQDIYNRRITKPNATQMQSDISNAARITYYFAVQNAIFYTLQTALFAMMFDDDEEDVNNLFIKKRERLINGSIDSVLRGSGLIGGVIATLKNVAIAFARQRDVKYNPDESAVMLEALNLSPVLGIKGRKIVNAEKTLNYNKKVIKEMETFDIDNPQWSAVTNYTEAFTNIPLNRLYNKTQNVRQALNNEHSAWERSLMFLGWSQYNLNLENKKMEDIKEKIKDKKKKGKKTLKTKTFKRKTFKR